MNSGYSVKWILIGALMMPGLTACSFFGDDEATSEEVAASTEENAAEAGEGDGQEVAEDGMTADPTAEEGVVDETMVSIPEDPALAAANAAAAESMAEAGMAEGAAADAGAPAEAMNGIPSELLGNTAPMDAAAAPAPDAGLGMPAAAPTSFTAAPGDARVYYVSVDALSLRDKPEGQSVGSLSMGDPVLVKVEGNWANVLNRGWVELASLSMGPIGRPVTGKSWN